MKHRFLLFPAAAFALLFATPTQSIATDQWEATIHLRFGRPRTSYGGTLGLLNLRVENREVIGTFRSSAGVRQTEIRVRGRLDRRLNPFESRQRISFSLETIENDVELIKLDGILERSGSRLKYT